MKRNHYSGDVCEVGIPLLKLEKKSEMEKNGYNRGVCTAGLESLKK